jgi:hypothetical protein
VVAEQKSSIHIAKNHEGRLHRALGVPEGRKIPASKIQEAMRSNNPHLRQMANFAKNSRGWNK